MDTSGALKQEPAIKTEECDLHDTENGTSTLESSHVLVKITLLDGSTVNFGPGKVS